MIIGLIFWIIIACLIFPFAKNRGRNGLGWFIFSVFFSPLLGFIVLLCLGDTEERRKEKIIEDEKLRQTLRS